MGPYRKYLLTGAPVPRNTLWNRRKREKLKYERTVDTSRNPTNLGDMRASQQLNHIANPMSGEAIVVHDSRECQQDTSLASEGRVLQTPSGYESEVQRNKSPEEGNDMNDDLLSDEEMLDSSRVQCASDSNVQNDVSDDADESTYDPSKKLSNKLCNCNDTTVGDLVFMCLTLGLRHNLTWRAQVDILKMLHSIYGDRTIPTNKWAYFNVIDKNHEDCLSYHIFCSKCEAYLGKREENEKHKFCTFCENNIEVSDPANYFVYLSIEAQLKHLLSAEHVASKILTHRFQRSKTSEDALEDIYDGEEYKKHCKDGGILTSPYNFSYSFFVDGVSTGKNTGKSLWPVYITINELPYEERSKYMLLAGIYIGNEPNQLVFLQPFVEEANKLSLEGFTWQYKTKSVISKVIPLCAVTDSVARCQVLNMQSYMAYYGCTFCYQKQVPTAPKKRIYDILSPKAEERTPESTREDALIAYEKRNEPLHKRHHRGVKGPSVLMGMLFFNLIWGCVVDYMHAVLLGMISTHMENLFVSTRKKFWVGVDDEYRVGLKHIWKCIDDRLLHIQPPSGITRIPRSIQNYKLWKASEWRSWLLFYCVPCLQGLLKDKYLNHLAMLSKATCLLLQKSVSYQDVQEAHSLYVEYCYLFQKYFNPQNTLYNIHLLTHIGKCVLNWGPLWTHNAFCYEAQNRHLLQLYKSPRFVLVQVARKFLIFNSIPSLCSDLVCSDSTFEFAEQLLGRQLIHFVRFGNVLLLGKAAHRDLNGEQEQCLVSSTSFQSKDCSFYQRARIKSMRLTTSEYSLGKQNNDSYVLTKRGMVVVIRHIILLPTGKIVFLVQTVRVFIKRLIESDNIVIEHIRKVQRYGGFICVSPTEIDSQCIFIAICGDEYVSALPFGCRGD